MTDLSANAVRKDGEPELSDIYDEAFYEHQVAGALQSARIFLGHLWRFLQPVSVLDVGCGRGAWLKACRELGSQRLYGFDGDWNNQSLMIDKEIRFRSIDLNQPFAAPEKVDVAISVEVAEHLAPSTAVSFVECLAQTSDAVLFSAAFKGQGGDNHINEQPHTYWAEQFRARGFAPFDLFRPVFWGDDNVCWWYRQNAFLYIRRQSEAWWKVKAHGLSEIADPAFMNCIHPALYNAKMEIAALYGTGKCSPYLG